MKGFQMSFSINSNIGANKASIYSGINSQKTDKSLGMLSSASKLNSAAFDAAGLAIANGLSSIVSGLGQATQNSNDMIGLLQVADGGMSGIEENMQRVRVLTLQASNGTLNDSDRAVIQKEIDGLLESVDSIANSTSYNGTNLLDASGGTANDGTFVTQSGANAGDTSSVTIGDARVASLVGSVDVTSDAGRAVALGDIDSALKDIGDIRSNLGASQNQLMSNIRNITTSQINAASAESQLRDVDFAQESANFSKANILGQIGSFAQAQANASKSNLSGLIG